MTRHATDSSSLLEDLLLDEYLSRRFVTRNEANLHAVPLGVPSDLPTQSGKKITWTYLDNPAAVTAAISTEGDDPPATDHTLNQASATLAEYGRSSEYSKFFELTAHPGTMEEMTDALAYQAALSYDTMVVDALDASTNVLTTVAAFDVGQILAGEKDLFDNNVQGYPDMGGRFCLLLGSEPTFDLANEGSPAWWQLRDQDLSGTSPARSPLGTAGDGASGISQTVIKRTTQIRQDTTPTPDDDLNLHLGHQGFGVASLESDLVRPRLIIRRPSQTDHPAKNRGTMTWWGLFAVVIIDENRVVVSKSQET